MNSDQEQVWDRLKYGLPSLLTTTVEFTGNGIATRFNSAWLGGSILCITIDDVAQCRNRDFFMNYNDIVFYDPPVTDAQIKVEAYT